MSEKAKQDGKDNGKAEAENKDKKSEKTPEKDKKEEKISKPVIITAEAYKTIILYASRYANPSIPPKDWKEIYGIMIGHTDDDFVYVERAEALTFGHSTDVQLDTKHYIFIDKIQQELENQKQWIVGWFHSHPGLGLFFSYIDLINQLGFQGSNDDFCGLVFDHTLLGKKKEEKIEGTDNVITKFDTGFEIYRLTNVNMDVNAPDFDNNYHNVDYIVDGLNKFFFANVLTELSALVTAGKPLQAAYGEELALESSYQDSETVMDNNNMNANQTSQPVQDNEFQGDNQLSEIPVSEDILFDVDDFFYDDNAMSEKRKRKAKIVENADQLIYEGNEAFRNKDTFTGVEKYRQGINKYKEIGDTDKVLHLLKQITEQLISTNHYVLGEEFAEDLFQLADNQDHLFYRAEGNYLLGYLMLKRGSNDSLEYQLKMIQEASIEYEKAGDYAGAGQCYYQIGMIYHTRLNQPFNAGLFFIEAIKNYNEGLLRQHPLRTSLWSKAEALTLKIKELKDIVEELIPQIQSSDDRKKIENDLNVIQFNF